VLSQLISLVLAGVPSRPCHRPAPASCQRRPAVVADRHPLCNCDAPMPANLCTAVCFERRDDVACLPVEGNPARADLRSLETPPAGEGPNKPAGTFSLPANDSLQATTLSMENPGV
jgi:hypothetical protein